MGASLAYILAHFRMKAFEEELSTEDEMSFGETKSAKQKCPICHNDWFIIAKPSSAKNVRTGITLNIKL